jgi:hypothetical protein
MVCFFSLLVLIMGAAGCGKKAMPSPPGAGPVTPVADLGSRLDGSHVILTWTLPAGKDEGEAVVSRAQTQLGPEMCEGCPLMYHQVAAIPFSMGQSAVDQSCQDSVSPGYRYTYKVILKMNNGRTSDPSLVTFDY